MVVLFYVFFHHSILNNKGYQVRIINIVFRSLISMSSGQLRFGISAFVNIYIFFIFTLIFKSKILYIFVLSDILRLLNIKKFRSSLKCLKHYSLSDNYMYEKKSEFDAFFKSFFHLRGILVSCK